MNTQDLITNAPHYLQVAGAIVGAASVIAALTPTPQDDGVLLVVRKLIDFLAFNFGSAKNKK